MRIFSFVSTMSLAATMLSGCLLYDYGVGHQVIQYRGIPNTPVGQAEGQYATKRKGKWEAEYSDGEYKAKGCGSFVARLTY